MRRRICLLVGRFDTTLLVSNGLAAWSRLHQPWRIEVHSQAEPRNINWLARTGYAGVVAVEPDSAMLQALMQLGCPAVAVTAPPSAVPTVRLDGVAIGRMGAEHLISVGRRQLTFYGLAGQWSLERFRGFEQVAKERGLQLFTNQRDGRWPTWNDAQDEQAVRRFLRGLRCPAGVMASCDMLARVLVDACADLDIRVPEDLAVVGVDNSEALCESDRMTLSSVDPDVEFAGQEAGRILDLLIAGRKAPLPTTLVPPRGVVQRRSTDAAAVSDPEIAAAVRFIRDRACEGLGVEDVCRHVAISRRQLERRFVAQLSRPPGDEIRSVRIARARELLALTNLSLTQIAIRCGYEHLSSFSAAFRDQTGMAPSRYRLSHATR